MEGDKGRRDEGRDGKEQILNGYRELILPYWKRWSVERVSEGKGRRGRWVKTRNGRAIMPLA